MSHLMKKVNSGPLAVVPLRAAEANLKPDTAAPVSTLVATAFLTAGVECIAATAAVATAIHAASGN
jgi:hypothetical protein